MHKFLILSAIILLSVTETFAYAVKVYDDYGNRVGTYRKVGQDYQFYDFYDRKIDNPETIIKNAPDKKTLTQYSQTFYDENMIPIGTYRSGFYGNDGRYYPRRGFYPTVFPKIRTPYIVRPNNHSEFLRPSAFTDNQHYSDSRFPKFHKFKY